MTCSRLIVILGLGVLLWAGAGCKTSPEFDPRKMDRARLVISRSGDTVSFSWISSEDSEYTIIYAERPNLPINEWEALPDCVNIPGTGEQMTFTIKDPEKSRYYFRLRRNPRR